MVQSLAAHSEPVKGLVEVGVLPAPRWYGREIRRGNGKRGGSMRGMSRNGHDPSCPWEIFRGVEVLAASGPGAGAARGGGDVKQFSKPLSNFEHDAIFEATLEVRARPRDDRVRPLKLQ